MSGSKSYDVTKNTFHKTVGYCLSHKFYIDVSVFVSSAGTRPGRM